MERTQLKVARVGRELSQSQLAEKIGYSREAINAWERGKIDPGADAIESLCIFFDRNPADLDLAKDLTESELRMIEEILKNKKVDRRQALKITTSPAFIGIMPMLSAQIGSPDQLLSQCNVAIKACWQLIKGDDLALVGEILTANMPTLFQLAANPSEFQEDAAFLAVQGTVLQVNLATCNVDFIGRNLLCRQAVAFGELSNNSLAYTTALYWQADTFVYCYHQPSKAIPLLEYALKCADSNAQPNKSGLYANLAIAYAQDRQERLALHAFEHARNVTIVTSRGALNSNLTSSGLHRDEGKMFLALAQHYPDKGYAQRAYDAFSLSLEHGPVKNTSLSQVLIHKADAARSIGDLDEFARCLERGVDVALQIDSKKHKSDAVAVRDRVPIAWRNETIYQQLAQRF